MTDSSDCESDAGASPSVSSDELSSSSGSSSPPSLKTASDSASRKRTSTTSGIATSTSTTPNVSFSSEANSSLNSSSQSVQKTPRKKQIAAKSSANAKNSSSNSKPPKGSQSYSTAVMKAPSSSVPVRKRKRPSQPQTSIEDPQEEDPDDKLKEAERKRKRNKKRRTRSERNFLAGKSGTTPSTSKTKVVTEGEEAVVALDAEIDRVLEEKANKQNLSATNVKSIIRHVITNNMVQKMIMSAMKKKAKAADAGGGSSDEDGLVGPKMTRAKTKELLENEQISLWPNVYTPVKRSKVPVSETHMLIQHDLPEDSSGDEEYVPKETDISELLHSDDESSSVTSHASDIGSPSPSISKPRSISRRSLQTPEPSFSDGNLFKTPPPRPSLRKAKEESRISRRTRSKFPLKDTALEDLERQFVPPDTTKDMYDWGPETDNEDYLDFLKDFCNPGLTKNDEMDDEADPEYNVMEDDEDLHDREELRMDRAVKVPKKELTQLIAELFEPGMLSGDDMDDHDLASLTGITPLVNEAPPVNVNATPIPIDSSLQASSSKNLQSRSSLTLTTDTSQMNASIASPAVSLRLVGVGDSKINNADAIIYEVGNSSRKDSVQISDLSGAVPTPVILGEVQDVPDSARIAVDVPSLEGAFSTAVLPSTSAPATEEIELPWFREQDLKLLQHQMRQHVQLLTQSYVLTHSNEDPALKAIAKTAKAMVIELKNFARMNGTKTVSHFAASNLDSGWNIVNFWPHKFLQQSPIKKKILEEKYITESRLTKDLSGRSKGNYFPRHVVKVIAENPVFMYNNLLPESYGQKNAQSRCTFIFSEDALLVGALEELKDSKKSAAQLAEVISNVLLTVRTPTQVYHRIRNLRKAGSVTYCDPAIKKYFTNGVLPEPDRTVPEITDDEPQPLVSRDREGLSVQWENLLRHFEDCNSSAFKWEEKLKLDPVVKSINLKWTKNQKSRAKARENSSDNDSDTGGVSPIQIETIDQVFPNGTYQIENTDPNVTAIPLLNANGKPGAIIYIPKYAFSTNLTQGGESNGNSSPVRPISESRSQHSSDAIQKLEPLEAQEAGGVQPQENIQSASSTNVNLIGLNHLIRRSQKTPLKNSPVHLNNRFPASPMPASTSTQTHQSFFQQQQQLRPGCGYHVVQPVGKPFSLSELGIPVSKSGDQIIDVSALQTPIKARIFQRAAEHDTQDVDIEEDHFQDDESCAVITEGSEVELTSEEEDDGNTTASCQGQSEIITLTIISDDEEDVKEDKIIVCGGGNEGKDSSSHSKTDGGSSSTKQSEGQSSQASTVSASSQLSTSRKSSSRPGKGDDSDEDNERRGGRKRSLPKDYYDKDEVASKENAENSSPEKEKVVKKSKLTTTTSVPCGSPGATQLQSSLSQSKSVVSTSTSSHHQLQQLPSGSGSSKPSSSKKAKRNSPGNPHVNSRRSSKYNVTSAEKLLEDEPAEFDDNADAYMEGYLARVQSTTEQGHPGLYATFVQTLMDAGEGPVNQKELYSKVKVLLKDYPDLLRDFESFLDASLDEKNDVSNVAGFTSRDEPILEIEFLQKIEKFTENCPQVKSKVFNKIKQLKERPGNLTEKDVANALEQFFVGNPVMMESFKALLPGVYRPHSASTTGMDFEEIELDMEDPPKEHSDDMHFEVVKLPDETTVPATSTCPCVCHTKTSDPAFSNRSKHCRKCSLKFQDGKIFIHNGRVMRPVSVELTPASPPKPGLVSSTSTATATASTSNRPCGSTSGHEPRARKDSHHSPHLTKSTEFKEPESCNKSSSDKKPHSFPPNSQHTQPHLVCASTSKSSQSKDKDTTPGDNEEVHHRLQLHASSEDPPSGKAPTEVPTVPQSTPPTQAPTSSKEEIRDPETDWTEEEDTIILTTCQEEPSLDVAWDKMAALLPRRRVEQIQERCTELIKLIQNADDE